jgi:hypothetical protein
MSLTIEPSEKRVLTRILNEPHDIMMRLIRSIQVTTGRKLILYVANFNHPLGAIHLLDVMPFEEVLRGTNSDSVDFLLNSPGGEINATEKLITMLRDRFKDIRVIVPNQAKSAATIMALASDKIIMGYLSELGPIDSQISVQNPDGTMNQIPAQSIIDSIELLTEKIEKAKKEGYSIDQYVSMAYRIDPNLWDLALKAQRLTAQFAEKWLTQFMCKGDAERAKEITGKFMDVKRFLSHGRMISVRDAKEILPENTIVELSKEDALWDMIWELYVRSEWRLNTSQAVKLFGNETGILSIGAVGPPTAPHMLRQPAQPQPMPPSSPQTREPSQPTQ